MPDGTRLPTARLGADAAARALCPRTHDDDAGLHAGRAAVAGDRRAREKAPGAPARGRGGLDVDVHGARRAGCDRQRDPRRVRPPRPRGGARRAPLRVGLGGVARPDARRACGRRGARRHRRRAGRGNLRGDVPVTSVLVLDSLFADLHVETETAAAQDASLARWDGSDSGLAGADVVLHVRTRVDAALIAAMPRCRAIGRFGTGLDTVDREAARAAGIAVVGVRDYCVPELPTHTLALAFALHRRLREVAGSDQSWEEVAAATPLRRGAHAAVIGLGDVGRRVAGALLALGYSVLPVTRTPALAHGLGLDPSPLADALRAADLIFLHVALDDSTRGMIDAGRLELMRP